MYTYIHTYIPLQIRLIVPLLDNQSLWFGGVKDFAVLYKDDIGGNDNITEKTFFTDGTVREGFKHFIRSLLLRNNTLTGVLYKDVRTPCWCFLSGFF